MLIPYLLGLDDDNYFYQKNLISSYQKKLEIY